MFKFKTIEKRFSKKYIKAIKNSNFAMVQEKFMKEI